MDHQSAKINRLRKNGALHPCSEKVSAEWLSQSAFFDAHDLVQMKYEMLRSASIDDRSVTDAAQTFGLSRVAFYRAQHQHNDQGVMGLLPRKRGPKQPHKLKDAILDFVREQRADGTEPADWQQLSQKIQDRFGIVVHPRSIERAFKQHEKKGRQ